jgi:hypothetical protein
LQDAKTWRFRIEPYLVFPNMNGNTGIAGLPLVAVDASPSDIFSNLQIGGMLYLEASKGKWSVGSDLLFMNLQQDVTPGTLIKGGEVKAKQFFWELAGYRQLNNWLEVGIGGILNSVEMSMSVDRLQPGGGTINLSGSQSKTWYDPMLITRLTMPNQKKFIGQLRAEAGGFGIGSDFAWHLEVLAGYRFSKLFNLTAGYKAVGMDYTSGSGNQAFVYDMAVFGPMLRLGFTF